MKVKDVIRMYDNGEHVEFLFFFHASSPFSNWHLSRFEMDGQIYWCVEQYMMAEKARTFGDKLHLKLIMESDNQSFIKAMGRAVKNYRDDVWDKKRYGVVYDACLAKFSQNNALKMKLLNTDNKVLVEASPYDKIWGIGIGETDRHITNPHYWNGKNLLGFVLMDVRNALK